MLRYTRIVFGLNAIYQTVLGLFCLLAPQTMIGLYGGTSDDTVGIMLQVAFRLLGVKLIPFGVASALIAGNPDDNPVLRGLMGLLAVLQLVSYGIIVGMHELNIGWIGLMSLNVLTQVLVLVAVVFYNTKKKTPVLVTRKRVA